MKTKKINYMKNSILIGIALFLVLFTFFLSYAAARETELSSSFSEAYEPRTVKVGITDFPFFSDKQEDGTYKGILCDYLKEIAKYTGWNLEYVENSPKILTDMLTSGEIDLMGGMMKTAEAMQLFNYAEYNSGYSYSTLIVKKENTQYTPMDYTIFQNMRVGIYRKATSRIASLESFCKANDITITPVYYDKGELLQSALEHDEVDAILANDNVITENQKHIAKFAAVPYYFAVTKGKTDILRELNTALLNILNSNPNFDNMLYDKYFEHSIHDKFVLTKAEAAYVQNAAPLRVVGFSDWAPIEYLNKDGKPAGISIDILNRLSQITGLQYNYIQVDSFRDAMNLIESGHADALAGLYDTMIQNDTVLLTLTQSYLTTPIVTVRNIDSDPNGRNILALSQGIFPTDIDPKSEIRYYSTISDCLKAVVSGKADYTIANSLVIDYYSHIRGENKLATIPFAKSTGGLSIGLAKPTDPILLSILDKAIYSIPPEEVQNSIFQHTSINNFDISLDYLIYNNPELLIFFICGICGVILITIFFIMWMRLHLSQQIALNGEAYRILGELTDEYIFEFDFEKKELKLPNKFAKLIGRKNATLKEKEDHIAETDLWPLISLFHLQDLQTHHTAESKCRLSDGHDEWFRVIGTIVLNSQKKPSRGIGKIVNIQEEKQEKILLENQANLDTITELYNKQHCIRAISNFFTSPDSKGKSALIIIDLDYFKKVNDTLGHLAGDEVLKDLADNLRTVFCSEALIGRWGGDEFIVFLCNITDETSVENQVEKLCQRMNKEFRQGEKSCLLSISVGIAFTEKYSSYELLFREADIALYAVKQGQRNGMHVYGHSSYE